MWLRFQEVLWIEVPKQGFSIENLGFQAQHPEFRFRCQETYTYTCVYTFISFGAIESVKTHACAKVEFVKHVKTISHSEGDRRPESQHSNPSASHQDRACGRAFQISGQSTSTYLESAAITQSASTRQTSSAQVQSPRAKRRGMLVGSERERSTGGGLWSDSESGSPKAAKLNLAWRF